MPFVPKIQDSEDTSNFDKMFTEETPKFSPVDEGKQFIGRWRERVRVCMQREGVCREIEMERECLCVEK